MFRRQAMYAEVRRCIQMAGRQLPAGPHAGCQRISSIKCHMSGSHSGSGTWRVWGRLEGSRKTARVSCLVGGRSERGSLKSCRYGRQFTQMCERDAAPRCASEAAEAAVGPAGRVGDGSAALLLGLRLGRLRGLAK